MTPCSRSSCLAPPEERIAPGEQVGQGRPDGPMRVQKLMIETYAPRGLSKRIAMLAHRVKIGFTKRSRFDLKRAFAFHSPEGTGLVEGEPHFLPVQCLEKHHVVTAVVKPGQRLVDRLGRLEEIGDYHEQRPV